MCEPSQSNNSTPHQPAFKFLIYSTKENNQDIPRLASYPLNPTCSLSYTTYRYTYTYTYTYLCIYICTGILSCVTLICFLLRLSRFLSLKSKLKTHWRLNASNRKSLRVSPPLPVGRVHLFKLFLPRVLQILR